MANKNDTSVVIDGKVYTLSGYESEEYLQKLAAFINNKINEVKSEEGFRKLPLDVQAIFIELNIADDYFKAKKNADALSEELADKEKLIYDLKHDSISAQIKIDANLAEIKELKEEILKYQKNIVRLETELDDLKKWLYGKVADFVAAIFSVYNRFLCIYLKERIWEVLKYYRHVVHMRV